MPQIDPRITLVGLVVGTLVGLSGVGGGSLVTPLLVMVLGIKPIVAVGTDLIYSVPTKIVGATVHHRQGTVNWRLVRYLVYGGIPAAVLGLVVLSYLQSHMGMDSVNSLVKHLLGWMLFLVSLAILVKPVLGRFLKQYSDKAELTWDRATISRIVALGAVVGFLVSLTSIGSGSLTVPLLYFLVPQLGLRGLVGSDVAFAAILIPIAAAGHLQMGHIDLGLALSLLLGSVPGVIVGSRFCAYFPDVWLRPMLAGALVFAGTRLV
ncbi:MAG TPA: sulfite exporter TauE/SafE family protein [Chloroflexota bacterium]|nr:sulfite exporter TauE/SafE family protein [Chloroflexota bacterium]